VIYSYTIYYDISECADYQQWEFTFSKNENAVLTEAPRFCLTDLSLITSNNDFCIMRDWLALGLFLYVYGSFQFCVVLKIKKKSLWQYKTLGEIIVLYISWLISPI
jgi:hypothetical protein